MLSKEQLEEFERTGYARDEELLSSWDRAENAKPANPLPSNARMFRAKVVQETAKAYKFKTKKSFFWIAKKLVYKVDRLENKVYFWDGAQITWIKK